MANIGRTIFIAAAVAIATHTAAQAQDYPTKAVRLIIGFAPGGPADAIGRLFGEKLNRHWGQPVIPEYRPGAGGNIASHFTAQSAPDGYTLLLAPNSHVINGALYTNLTYDPIKDFTPIIQIAYYSLVIVANRNVPVHNVKDLVAFAKANPGKATFGSAGVGTPTHLANELFRREAGIDLVHVAYKGAAPATTDLLGGQIQFMFNNPLSALPHVKSDRLRAIGTTGLVRSATFPEVPTVAESGYPGFEVGTWYALIGPAGMPKEVISKIASDVAAITKMSDVRERLLAQGIETRSSTPEQLGQIMKSEFEKWSQLIRAANIKPN